MQLLAALGNRLAEQEELAALESSDSSRGQTCDMISGAVKRNGWHMGGANCKCESHDAVLSEKCGEQSGKRTFELMKLNQDLRGLWNAKKNGCACVEEPEDAGQGSPEPEDAGDDVKKQRQVTAEVALCGHVENAVSIDMFDGACECPENYFLSPECGDRAGTRYFEAKDATMRKPNCRCRPIEEPKEDEQQPAKGSELECEHPFPEGFQLGDIVRIVKSGSKLNGAVAEVVCPKGTSGVKGRACLRWANKQNSAGCWLPANLEKL